MNFKKYLRHTKAHAVFTLTERLYELLKWGTFDQRSMENRLG